MKKTKRKPTRVAINGLGWTSRKAISELYAQDEYQIVAINAPNIFSTEMAVKLIKYALNSNGEYSLAKNISCTEDTIDIDGHKIRYFKEKNTLFLPWEKMKIDIVIDGYSCYDSISRKHLEAGAKNVLNLMTSNYQKQNIKGEKQ